MNSFTFASFLKVLKKYIPNKGESDENYVNEWLSPIIENRGVKNRNKELYWLTPSHVSELLRNKSSVPRAILKELEDPNLPNIIKEDQYSFFENHFDDVILSKAVSDILELMDNDSTFPKEIVNKIKTYQNDSKYCLLLMFIESLKVNNITEVRDERIVWSRGNSSIKVIQGDIFKFGFRKKGSKNIVVIPVDSSFSTEISCDLEEDRKPLVSTETLHGMWLRRCQNSKISPTQLQNRIEAFLVGEGVSSENKNNRRNYPIGTIVPLELSNAVFFLLACSSFDEYNLARSSKEHIQSALISLIQYYNQRGQGYPLYIPLLGTGRSRANLTYTESYDIIIETLIENDEYIQGRIVVVLTPEAYQEMEVNK